jgi:hypothetical protein
LRVFFLAALFVLTLGGSCSASASLLSTQIEVSGLTTEPSLLGGEGALAEFISVGDLFIGPKLGFLYASGSAQTRSDGHVGLEAILFSMNAIGVGFSADLIKSFSVSPSSLDSNYDPALRYRIEPHLTLRFKHLGEKGALALRLGLPYDTRYHLGVRVGIAIQFFD